MSGSTGGSTGGPAGGCATVVATAAGAAAGAAGAWRTRTVAAATAVVAAATLGGCGIRSTSVPVDAGAAPSRVACAAPTPSATPAPGTATPAPGWAIRQVYLVCSMAIAPVNRRVQTRMDGTGLAQGLSPAADLLTQLQVSPLTAEAKAGFSTAVPGSLYIARPEASDPKEALRLSQPVEELPSFALAQIVCTFTADHQIAPSHAVVLGGPGTDQLRRYTCTEDLLTRADAADNAGTPVK